MFPNTQHTRGRVRRGFTGAAFVAAAVVALAGCAGGGGEGQGGGGDVGPEGLDDGTTLSMWTRAATQAQSEAFVEAYNASHENQVELTVIPTDDYQAKVGAAAGAQNLPDLFAADVVFVPNYTSQGLFTDITDRIASLDFADDIVQSHIDVGTYEDRQYVLPHTMDLSVMFWNKTLYEQAGLDPEAPPTTLEEFAEQARAVDALGGDVNGTFFGGNCGGCAVFTWWPSVWADGGEVLNEEGTEATLDTPEMESVFEIWRGLVADDVVAPGFREETGATWTGVFPEGNVGVMPMPSTTIGLMPDDLDFGVAPLPGVEGGESTFVGGDSIGIAASSEKADAAWNFLAWTMSDEAQLEVVAQNGDVVARSDLASNEYSDADPRLVTANEIAAEGRTPKSLRFGEAFNDPNGPWLAMVRNAVLEDGGEFDQRLEEIDAILSQ